MATVTGQKVKRLRLPMDHGWRFRGRRVGNGKGKGVCDCTVCEYFALLAVCFVTGMRFQDSRIGTIDGPSYDAGIGETGSVQALMLVVEECICRSRSCYGPRVFPADHRKKGRRKFALIGKEKGQTNGLRSACRVCINESSVLTSEDFACDCNAGHMESRFGTKK